MLYNWFQNSWLEDLPFGKTVLTNKRLFLPPEMYVVLFEHLAVHNIMSTQRKATHLHI